jgi:hypothetical protein
MNDKMLLKMLDIDENVLPENYDSWGGDLWSYANDLESYDNALSYAWEMFDEETGEGKEQYEKAVKEYNVNIDKLRNDVLNYIGELK